MLPGAQTLGLQCHSKCPAGRCCSVPRDVLRASSAALFVQVLPGCIQGTAVLETAVLPWAVAGQGEREDGKGWETLKDILPFSLKSMDGEMVGVSGGLGSCSYIFYIMT